MGLHGLCRNDMRQLSWAIEIMTSTVRETLCGMRQSTTILSATGPCDLIAMVSKTRWTTIAELNILQSCVRVVEGFWSAFGALVCVCKTRASCLLSVIFFFFRSFAGDVAASPQCLPRSSLSAVGFLRFPSRSTSLISTVFRTACRRTSLLSLTTSLFFPPLHTSSVMGTSPLLALSRCVLQCCSLPHPLTVRGRLGPTSLPVRWFAPLATLSPLPFSGLPPFPAFVQRSPCGGSCRRVHDLFLSPVLRPFLQCALLPSTHSLRMFGLVSAFLWRALPFLHAGPLVPPLSPLFLAASFEHLDIPSDFCAPCQLFTQLSLCP